IHQTTTVERSSGRWILPLVLLALIPGLLWLFSHSRRPVAPVVTEAPPPTTGTANRVMPDEVVQIPKRVLPASIDLYFDTASSKLRPDSQARLNEFARALKDNPDARVSINGYTDDRGKANANLRLSQSRANAVKADLERRGLSAGTLTAKGFGEED